VVTLMILFLTQKFGPSVAAETAKQPNPIDDNDDEDDAVDATGADGGYDAAIDAATAVWQSNGTTIVNPKDKRSWPVFYVRETSKKYHVTKTCQNGHRIEICGHCVNRLA